MIFLRSVSAQHVEDPDYGVGMPVFRWLLDGHRLHFRAPITFITGENGAGKSTLVESLARVLGLHGAGGAERRFMGTGDDFTSNAYRSLLIRKTDPIPQAFFLRGETYLDTVNALGMSTPGSHGESIIEMTGYLSTQPGVYILDEPEAGLSAVSQMALLAQFAHGVEAGAQWIVATHSPILLATPGAHILEVHEDGITEVSYRESQPFRHYAEFFADPEGVAAYLVGD
ncbi:AAA family ATPase [Corynebacterium renale]|uniref:Putative ATPase n=1 Tax=Corynebacterium renale TaxID=1724 RepID=A0A2A9DNY6_9CORY|nr:AAA family ATPase [Corynebacterium renale]PFG28314.1 putative ATPase [Corynebacterium renale]SQI19070.1 ABC transporter ATPase [Corynebacterium renale]